VSASHCGFADDYSATATTFRSIAGEVRLRILLPLFEALHNRKVINTESAR
jgi:hypothetical protein